MLAGSQVDSTFTPLHTVVPVVIDNLGPIDEQLAAVIGFGVEGIVTTNRRGDNTGKPEAKIVILQTRPDTEVVGRTLRDNR